MRSGTLEAMAAAHAVTAGSLLALFALFSVTSAADPDMLQDLCVADLNSTLKVNGFPCKTSLNATAFFSNVLAKRGTINNTVGSLVTTANVVRVPGLNTLGISMARIDYLPGGHNPPHTHPRATEMIFVLEGALDVGFITTANELVGKTVQKGEVFVFPRGLVHFERTNGCVNTTVIAAFNSQLPGAQSLAKTLFAAKPSVKDDVLSIAFQIDAKEVRDIKAKLAPKK